MDKGECDCIYGWYENVITGAGGLIMNTDWFIPVTGEIYVWFKFCLKCGRKLNEKGEEK